MGMEMCPSCRAVCNLIVTTSTRIVRGKDQEKKRIRTRSFHCERCFQFVRSEDDERGRNRDVVQY